MAARSLKFFMYYLVVGLLFDCGPAAKADKESALKAVIAAWKKRQQETQSFRFEWSEKWFIPKEQLPVPTKEDARFQKKAGVIVADSRMTTYSEGPHWNRDGFVPSLYRSVFDGTNSKTFRNPLSEGLHPIGHINSIRHNLDAVINYRIPIQLAYRAFHPIMGRFDEAKMQVIDEKSNIRNRECIRIEQKKSTYVARCWVDPSRDYAIVRYVMVFEGFPTCLCDVEYKLDNQFGWVPESWHDVLMNRNTTPESLSEDRSVQVTSYVLNGPVEDQEFQLEFPPRTEVMDLLKDQFSVVLDDGSIRLATRAEKERGITYEELLRSEGKTWGRNILTAASIAGFGMIFGLLLLWVRKKQQKPA